MYQPKKRIVKSKLPPAGRYNTSGFFGGSSSLTVIKPAVLGRPAKPIEVEVPIEISEDADADADGCESLDEDLSLSPVQTNEAAAKQLAQPPEAFAKWPRVENFSRVQLPCAFVGLARIGESANAVELTKLIIELLLKKCNMTLLELARKLVCLATDGASVFHGGTGGVIALMKRHYAPYVHPMHCVAHRTQLCAVTLTKERMFERILNFMKGLAAYYSRSPKRIEALGRWAEEEGLPEPLRVLRMVETRWLSARGPLQLMLWRLEICNRIHGLKLKHM
jgi:hypothetical protein